MKLTRSLMAAFAVIAFTLPFVSANAQDDKGNPPPATTQQTATASAGSVISEQKGNSKTGGSTAAYGDAGGTAIDPTRAQVDAATATVGSTNVTAGKVSSTAVTSSLTRVDGNNNHATVSGGAVAVTYVTAPGGDTHNYSDGAEVTGITYSDTTDAPGPAVIHGGGTVTGATEASTTVGKNHATSTLAITGTSQTTAGIASSTPHGTQPTVTTATAGTAAGESQSFVGNPSTTFAGSHGAATEDYGGTKTSSGNPQAAGGLAMHIVTDAATGPNSASASTAVTSVAGARTKP